MCFYAGLLAFAMTATQAVKLDSEQDLAALLNAVQTISEKDADSTVSKMMKPSKAERMPSKLMKSAARKAGESKAIDELGKPKKKADAKEAAKKKTETTAASATGAAKKEEDEKKKAATVPALDPEKIKAIVDQEVNKKVAEIKKKEDKTKKTVDKKAAVKEKKEDKKKQVA